MIQPAKILNFSCIEQTFLSWKKKKKKGVNFIVKIEEKKKQKKKKSNIPADLSAEHRSCNCYQKNPYQKENKVTVSQALQSWPRYSMLSDTKRLFLFKYKIHSTYHSPAQLRVIFVERRLCLKLQLCFALCI